MSTEEDDATLDARNELLEAVMEFCIGQSFEKEFEKFAEKNSQIFLDAGILDMPANSEYPLSFHDCYLDYLRKFEAKIERFIEERGSTLSDFFAQARDILEDADAYGPQRFFLEALLATAEYENFVVLMKGEMHKYLPTDKDGSNGGEGKSGESSSSDGGEGKSSHK